eukprot:14322378-Ditylum_brightwellii.AAC.1
MHPEKLEGLIWEHRVSKKDGNKSRKFSSFPLHNPSGSSGWLEYDLQCGNIICKWQVHMKYCTEDAQTQQKTTEDYSQH